MKRVIKHKFDTSKYVIVDSRGKRVMNNEDKLIEEMNRTINNLYNQRVSQEGICRALRDMVQAHDVEILKSMEMPEYGHTYSAEIKAIEGK